MDLQEFTPQAALQRKLNAKRNDYISDFSTLYLGDVQLRSLVRWVPSGGGRVLVSTRIVSASDADAIRSALPPDTTVQPCSNKLPTGSQPPDSPPNTSNLFEVTEPAILTTVVRISNEDYYFTSDANYSGPTKYTKSLAEVRPTCTGTNPELAPFRDDFSTVIDNLVWLQDKVCHPEIKERKGVLVGVPSEQPRVKVRHILFETKSPRDDDSSALKDGEETQENPLPPAFHIENWPTSSETSARELEDMKATHNVNPIPAYDKDGNLIYPTDYRAKLSRAVVELRFTLRYYTIGGGSKIRPGAFNCFSADIVDMLVLVPPPPAPPSPRKRRLVTMQHPSSPSKRSRVVKS